MSEWEMATLKKNNRRQFFEPYVHVINQIQNSGPLNQTAHGFLTNIYLMLEVRDLHRPFDLGGQIEFCFKRGSQRPPHSVAYL